MAENNFQRQPGKPDRVFYLYAGVFILLLLITWMVFVSRDLALDESVFTFLSPFVTPERTVWMKAITFLGNYKFLVPANLVLIAILLLLKKRFAAWQVFVVAISGLGFKLWLKELFARPRPDNPMVDGIMNFSFPSGHALMGIAFYGLLIWLAEKHIRNSAWRRISISLLVLLILLISFSRIYLRVHYTTDVLAGLCMGLCWLYFCLWFTEKINNRHLSSGLKDKPVDR
jgi:membrane-associated phospholipid phosphatase